MRAVSGECLQQFQPVPPRFQRTPTVRQPWRGNGKTSTCCKTRFFWLAVMRGQSPRRRGQQYLVASHQSAIASGRGAGGWASGGVCFSPRRPPRAVRERLGTWLSVGGGCGWRGARPAPSPARRAARPTPAASATAAAGRLSTPRAAFLAGPSIAGLPALDRLTEGSFAMGRRGLVRWIPDSAAGGLTASGPAYGWCGSVGPPFFPRTPPPT